MGHKMTFFITFLPTDQLQCSTSWFEEPFEALQNNIFIIKCCTILSKAISEIIIHSTSESVAE